jgi:hypothetical protein
MTEAEKLAFHTEVYAFRAVYLEIQEETSPCDPKGQWFNRDLVMQLTRTKYSKRERVKREKAAARDIEMQREGRDIVNKWAQREGFDDIDAYCDAMHVPWVDAYTEIVQQICASTPHESGRFFPRRLGRWRLLADCIGGGGTGMRPERAVPLSPPTIDHEPPF